MTDIQDTAAAEVVIRGAIQTLLERRGVGGREVLAESKLTADLGMDSLELAELSAMLEDDLGRDPYSDGIVPETVAALVSYYHS